MNANIQFKPITVFLDRNAHNYALQFASEQITQQKGKQVYLNTLAVCAVYTYCQWLQIKTNLSQGDCWQSGLRAIFNIADLVIPNVGKLECRLVLAEERELILPPEAIEDRIGYVAVRFSEILDKVEILGFLPAMSIAKALEPIPLTKLQSLDVLIETIDRESRLINLNRWFEEIFAPEWRSIDFLLSAEGRLLRSTQERSIVPENDKVKSVSRGKIIALPETDKKIILTLKATKQTSEEIELCLRVYPVGENNYLPSELEVKLLDELENICLQAKTRDSDNWLQLQFSCHNKEKFSVKIILEDKSIIEQFIA